MKAVPICPDCKEEFTRFEWLDGWGQTGFCHPCAKHFELCSSNLHMSRCVRSKGHFGNHIDRDGREFVFLDDDRACRVAPTLDRTVFDYKVIIETVPASQLAKEQPKPRTDGKLGWVVIEEIGPAMINGRSTRIADIEDKTKVGFDEREFVSLAKPI